MFFVEALQKLSKCDRVGYDSTLLIRAIPACHVGEDMDDNLSVEHEVFVFGCEVLKDSRSEVTSSIVAPLETSFDVTVGKLAIPMSFSMQTREL